MKIDRYETEQFAGITDKSVDFEDGVNVIYGDNETGKSTVIAGIYATLFQPAEGKKSSSGYKTFEELYKPVGADLDSGVFTDGKVKLTVGGSKVEIAKTWFTDPETKIKVDGTSYKSKGAETKIEEILKLGAAFYNNIVFGRQNHEEDVLNWLFDNSASEGKTEITKRIADLSSVVSGTDIGRLSELIDEKLSSLSGRWDADAKAPMKDRGRAKDIQDPWKAGVGEILAAYYEWKNNTSLADSTRAKIDGLSKLDVDKENQEKRLKSIKEELKYIADNKANYQSKKAYTELLAQTKREGSAMVAASKEWPGLSKDITDGEKLLKIKAQAEAIKERDALTKKLDKVLKLQASMDDASKANLSSLYAAHIKTQNDQTIHIEDSDGAQEVSGDEKISLKGFIHIDIPGVADIMVEDASATANIEKQIELVLDGITVDELKSQIQNIQVDPDVIVPDDYAARISKYLSGRGRNIESVIAVDEQKLSEYMKLYTSIDKLSETIKEKAADVKKYQDELDKLPELTETGDIEAKEVSLTEEEKRIDDAIKEIIKLKAATESEVSSVNIDELEDMADTAKEKYNKLLHTYDIYAQIKSDLEDVKEHTDTASEDVFRDKLQEYLAYITADRLNVADMDEKLGLSIKSDDHILESPKHLSEGTKETLILAYKMAVMDMFFTDEGGVLVLDDILLDMDPLRRDKSVELIKNYAKHNQVIYTTCDPTCAKMLGGHLIELSAIPS